MKTLDLLAQEGILFTILAPHQCDRVRERAETTLQPLLEPLEDAGARWIDTPQRIGTSQSPLPGESARGTQHYRLLL